MTKLCQRIRKVADTKSSPSTLMQKSIVFKLFHSGERFQKVPFSWIFLCVLVWTEAVSVTIKLRFQIYRHSVDGPKIVEFISAPATIQNLYKFCSIT